MRTEEEEDRGYRPDDRCEDGMYITDTDRRSMLLILGIGVVALIALLLSPRKSDGAAITTQMMIPKGPDPSQMSISVRSGGDGRLQPCVAFIPEGVTNCSAWTYLVWLKSSVTETQPGGDVTVSDMSRYIPDSFFSASCARSTSEGGPELQAYWTSSASDWEDYDAWSAYVPPPQGVSWAARPSGVFPNGVVCVQVSNPNGYPVTVHSVSLASSLSYGAGETNIVFNVEVPGGGGNVCGIVLDGAQDRASASSVTVRAAAQPIVQFLSMKPAVFNNDGDMAFVNRDAGFPGVTCEEYVLHVVQARMLDSGRVEHRIWGAVNDLMYPCATVTNSLDSPNPSPHFMPGSRIGISLHNPMNNVSAANPRTNDVVYVYGPKLYLSWLSTNEVRVIRDQDVSVMRGRGIEFPDKKDYWYLTYDRKTRTVSTDGLDLSGEIDVTWRTNYFRRLGDVCSFGYHTWGGTVSNTYEFTASVHNGDYNQREISIGEIRLVAPGASSVDGNVVVYPQPGPGVSSEQHTIYAIDTVTGTVKTNTVSVFVGSSSSYSTKVTGRGAGNAESIAAKIASHSFSNALAGMTWDGSIKTATVNGASYQYKDWKVKRIPCLPVSSTAGPQGNRGMGALSPHTYFSAWHWRGWSRSTERFVTPDGSVTATVTTASGAVNLAAWAKSNGFDPAYVDSLDIGDIAVNRFSSGEVPAECCPILFSAEDIQRSYGTNSESIHPGAPLVMGWGGTQTRIGHALPVAIYPNAYGDVSKWYYYWRTARDIMSWPAEASSQTDYPTFDGLITTGERNWITNSSILASHGQNPMFAPVYGGDSGLGIFIDTGGGEYALVSHFHYVSGGPSYIGAYPVLKAYIEANGDTVRKKSDWSAGVDWNTNAASYVTYRFVKAPGYGAVIRATRELSAYDVVFSAEVMPTKKLAQNDSIMRWWADDNGAGHSDSFYWDKSTLTYHMTTARGSTNWTDVVTPADYLIRYGRVSSVAAEPMTITIPKP